MKYTKFKEILHFTIFGSDDALRGTASSFSTVALGRTSDAKTLSFSSTPFTDVILSNFARILIQCANLPSTGDVEGCSGKLAAPFTIRRSFTNDKIIDSQNNGTNPLLFFIVQKAMISSKTMTPMFFLMIP
jgi:hypothetical protein